MKYCSRNAWLSNGFTNVTYWSRFSSPIYWRKECHTDIILSKSEKYCYFASYLHSYSRVRGWSRQNTQTSRRMKKPTTWPLRQAKTQISLGIRLDLSVVAVCMKKHWVLSYPLSARRRLWSAWSESSLGAQIILLVLSWGGLNVSSIRMRNFSKRAQRRLINLWMRRLISLHRALVIVVIVWILHWPYLFFFLLYWWFYGQVNIITFILSSFSHISDSTGIPRTPHPRFSCTHRFSCKFLMQMTRLVS